MRRARAGAAVIALCLFLCAMTAGNVRAQQPLSVSVRADNDAFNFWLPPYAKPDEEYTSGVRASLTYAGPAPWQRWLTGTVRPCANGTGRCPTHTFSFGQDIYTGIVAPGDTSLVPGTRPNAGWLYVQESARIAATDRLDETSVTLGITGPQALGEPAQRAFHSLLPSFNRPIDWATQLPFEPGIILAYDRTQRMFVRGEGERFGADVEPHAGASAGNILTEARAGVRVRGGFRLQHPWQMAATTSMPEVSLFADATVHGVVRNEFLAGTMFRPSAHVRERPFVAEYQTGLNVRWHGLTLAYSVDRTASEYVTRANGHTWSRIGFEWRIARR